MARNGFQVFDSDMHIMEPPDLWERYIDPEFRSIAPRGITSANVRDLRIVFPGDDNLNIGASSRPLQEGRTFERNQLLYADHASRGWTADCQIEAMDNEGIDVAVLFPTRGLSVLGRPHTNAPFAAAIARAYNDWLFDFCKTDPTRLLGAAMLSVFDVQDAIDEAHRAVEELGFKAVFFRSIIVNGKNWYDPYYEPLWDTLEKLQIPVGFHEAFRTSNVHQVGETFEPNVALRRAYAQPVGQMVGLGAFVGGGILARHPMLKVAFLEANCAWVPWLLWRLDEGYEREGDVFMPELTMAPSEYFKRQCYVSVEPDEFPAQSMIQTFGADQVVFSTDYPHFDSKYPEAVDSFLKMPLTDEEKRKILWDNCARFYSVEAFVSPSPPLGERVGVRG
ncbi:MAG: BarH protein [Chloroflexi bacterium]|nr:BarH protein [Chloroflexota bacterium]